MNVKHPKRGWSDGVHCLGVVSPCRPICPIVPARYRGRTVLAGTREVKIVGTTHIGLIAGMIHPTGLCYFTHAQLRVLGKAVS